MQCASLTAGVDGAHTSDRLTTHIKRANDPDVQSLLDWHVCHQAVHPERKPAVTLPRRIPSPQESNQPTPRSLSSTCTVSSARTGSWLGARAVHSTIQHTVPYNHTQCITQGDNTPLPALRVTASHHTNDDTSSSRLRRRTHRRTPGFTAVPVHDAS